MNIIKQSKFLSLVLRHKPEEVGLTLESSGWALVSDVLTKCKMTMTDLKVIVEQNDKKRFEFNEDMTKIRASQGHSIEVDLKYNSQTPPDYLYHGTPEHTASAILKEGIKKMKRHSVHLSADKETAIDVAKRRGDPVVLTIDAKGMHEDGHEFFLSTNKVWLTEFVPLKYIQRASTNPKKPKQEGYPDHWKHCTIHLNPKTGEMHSDGDHSVRTFIEDTIKKLEGTIKTLEKEVEELKIETRKTTGLKSIVKGLDRIKDAIKKDNK